MLQALIDKAKNKNSQRNSDRLMDLYESLKGLDESSLAQMPNLRSANFYYKIFGLDFGTQIDKEQRCDHTGCKQFFIEKLSESSSVLNRASHATKSHNKALTGGHCHSRTRESNNISLVKLFQN